MSVLPHVRRQRVWASQWFSSTQTLLSCFNLLMSLFSAQWSQCGERRSRKGKTSTSLSTKQILLIILWKLSASCLRKWSGMDSEEPVFFRSTLRTLTSRNASEKFSLHLHPWALMWVLTCCHCSELRAPLTLRPLNSLKNKRTSCFYSYSKQTNFIFFKSNKLLHSYFLIILFFSLSDRRTIAQRVMNEKEWFAYATPLHLPPFKTLHVLVKLRVKRLILLIFL